MILLDEPTTGVDPVSRREFWKLLSQFLATGITILMSTPYLDEAERCTRVALLDRGRLLALDAPDALRAALPGTLLEVIAPDLRQAHRLLDERGLQGAGVRRSPARLDDVGRSGSRSSLYRSDLDLDTRRSSARHHAVARGCVYRASVGTNGASTISRGARTSARDVSEGHRDTASARQRRGQHRGSYPRQGEAATMKRFYATTACALLACAATTAHAQDQAATRLTLSDAIARTMAESHRLAEARARQEGAQAAIRTHQVSDYPTIALNGSYTRTNHVEIFAVPQANGPIRVFYPDIPDNFASHATFQWPIYTGGRSDALVRAAEAEARAATADIDVTRADLRLEVTRAYWGLVTATESVRVVEEALSRADAHLRDVRAQFQAGLIPPNDVAAAETQRSHEELQRIEARNLRSSTLEDLRRLTGLTTDIVPEAPLTAQRPAAIPAAAVAKRAEQLALAERVSASEERVAAIKSGAKPTVSVHAAADYANPNPRFFPRAERWRASWEVGAMVNWNLWDGGRIGAESAEAAAATRALRARQAEVDSLIATEVRSAAARRRFRVRRAGRHRKRREKRHRVAARRGRALRRRRGHEHRGARRAGGTASGGARLPPRAREHQALRGPAGARSWHALSVVEGAPPERESSNEVEGAPLSEVT